MKYLLILLISLPLSLVGQTDVKKVTNCNDLKYTLIRDGKQEQQHIKIYNSKGDISSQVSTFSNASIGSYTEEYTYEYDTKGNNTAIVYKQNGVEKKSIKKEFDENGKLIKEATNNGSIAFSKNESVQKNNATETIQIFYQKDGVTESLREKTLWNANNKLLKKEVKNATGKTIVLDERTYDNKENILSDSHFDSSENTTTLTKYEYSPQGYLLGDKTTKNDVLFAETKYENSNSGQLLKKTRLNGKGLVEYYYSYEYNSKGDLIKENYYYKKDLISSKTFEYDQKGNKTKEVFFDRQGKEKMSKTWEFDCK